MTPKEETPATLAGASGATQNEKKANVTIPQSTPGSKKDNRQSGQEPPEPPRPLPWASSFKIGGDGVYRVEMKDEAPVDVWVFSPLVVEARTRDSNGQNWGLLLAVQSPDGKWHRWAMPAQMLGGNGSTYREILLGLGLQAPNAQKHLHAYLATARPERMVRCVDKMGWHGGTYVLMDVSFGNSAEEMFLQSSYQSLFRTNGTLRDWQRYLGCFCPGNSRLVFAACAGLAAPLLKICGMDGGGFNFQGNSSIGKTTILTLAGSVSGGGGQSGFLRTWRTTDNALETIALAHNDGLLCLDEMAQITPQAAAESSYMLANGQGKSRANKDGTVRLVAEWRLLFLSSGEISLEQKLQEDGRRYMAGQAVRVIDIPADAGKGHGIFDALHQFAGGKEFSEHIRKASAVYYGTPLRAFLAALAADVSASSARAREMLKNFEARICPPQAGGQVQRAAKRFALMATAGEMAIEYGVFPWEPGKALWAAQHCIQDWLAFRGGLGAAERREIIRRVRSFIAAHGSSRFESWTPGSLPVYNRAGFRKEGRDGTEYLFTRDAFEQEICRGGNAKVLAGYLRDAGFLVTDSQGNLMKPHTRSKEEKSTRYYTVKGDILDSDE